MKWTKLSSVWWLVVANLVPLVGVLYLGWDLFTLLLLYWVESAVVGFFNVLRMLKISAKASHFYVPFFIFHFGIFMFVHLVFIFTFFSAGAELRLVIGSLVTAVVALVISHSISYAANFVGRREYTNRTVKQQLFAPYGRVVVMHLTVLVGGFLALFVGVPIGALVVMVGVKIGLDVLAHLKQHGGLGVVSARSES